MQLIRHRLRAATCALLAVAGGAAADSGDWHFDAGTLYYSEQGRTSVVEPLFRAHRNFSGGSSLTGKIVLDAITGASPNGAMLTDHVQTFTSASGQRRQQNGNGEGEHRARPTVVPAGEMPVRSFQDHRAAVDVDYELPLARTLKTTLGGHWSAETDYISKGATLTFSVDTQNKLNTFTLGAGENLDQVNPIGGKPIGMALSTDSSRHGNANKNAFDGMIGMSRVLSRRWLAQVNYGYAVDNGYLTEPYKLVSVLDSVGSTTAYRYEQRPDSRRKQNATVSSVYQMRSDVLRVSYRYYWDDWGTHSHTVDIKYRYDLPHQQYFEPHARYYAQTAVDFYTFGLRDNLSPPSFATSDYRYGKLNSLTLGAKYGFQLYGGEFNVRVEYLRQSGDSHPAQAFGVQRNYNLFPTIHTIMVQLGYGLDL